MKDFVIAVGAMFALIIISVALSGCAPDIKLYNPRTMATAECAGGYYQRGVIGMANETAKDLQFRCLDDYQRAGFVRQ